MDNENMLWEPIIFFGKTDEDLVTASASNDDEGKFNLSFFMSDEAKIEGDSDSLEKELKKQTKKRKSSANDTSTAGMIPIAQQPIGKSTEVPYSSTYEETSNMIKNTILQVDILSSEIKGDIDSIRASKSLKGKYTYLTNLNSAASSLLATKLNAIRELNNSITQSHNLELKRAKDLKEIDSMNKNDDARMMDLYSAFINAPMGMYDNKLNMPTIPEMMLGVNDPNSGIKGVSMNGTTAQQNQGNISPEQLRMRMENNSDIEEVVVYDPASGRRWFDVIDKNTGQSVPNFPKSDAFLLEDISIETRSGIAQNRNLDRVWPLKVVGGINMSEY